MNPPYIPLTTDYSIERTGFGSLPARAGLEKILADRLGFIKGTIVEIKGLLKERQELKTTLISDIVQDVCEVRYELHLLDRMPPAPERKSALERQLMELYKEDRSQRLQHWQDTVMLKRELKKTEKELRTAMLDLWMLRFLS